MGDPKKLRKSYDTPNHPWNKARIDAESQLKKDFRFKNKKELWKTTTKLTKFKDIVKGFATREGGQVGVERVQIKDKLVSLGLLKPEDELSATLSITDEDIMGRRLQSVVVKRKLARTMKHARQLIVHKHISIGDKVVTSPSRLISLAEENTIAYAPGSPYVRSDHPERYIEKELKEIARKREAEAATKKDEAAAVEDLIVVPEDDESPVVGKKLEVKGDIAEPKDIEIPEDITVEEDSNEESKEDPAKKAAKKEE